MKDFFISYTRSDEPWAEWIAEALEGAGHTTVSMARDFLPGSNFVVEMHKAASECRRTVVILSQAYLESPYAMSEWAAAFASDPTGGSRKLLPVRVGPCEATGLLRQIVYCDLVGLDEREARKRLADAARDEHHARTGPAPFPGRAQASAPTPKPGAAEETEEARAARDLLSILRTTYKTFVAQCRVRDELVEAMCRRLNLTDMPEYERFFSRFYQEMNGEERYMHSIIRAYTENVLSAQNARALEILNAHPRLVERVRLLPELQEHLTIWLGKYKSVLQASPAACLLYVGVEEGVPFPAGVEDELKLYLEGPETKPPKRRRPSSAGRGDGSKRGGGSKSGKVKPRRTT